MPESNTGFDDPIGALTLDRFADTDDFWHCQPSIVFVWDHWAECVLECPHGRWLGVADGVNFSEAFEGALAHYEGADHSSCREVR